MPKYILFTQEGLDKVQKEKAILLEKRKEAVYNLRQAREMGDLSENGAYKAARATLSSIDSRIRHLDYLIRSGRVAPLPYTDEIGISSKVKLFVERKYLDLIIVGSFESDPSLGKISHLSPLGKALIGKKVGEKIVLATPVGTSSYQIINVTNRNR